jgi:hypothetical protein
MPSCRLIFLPYDRGQSCGEATMIIRSTRYLTIVSAALVGVALIVLGAGGAEAFTFEGQTATPIRTTE